MTEFWCKVASDLDSHPKIRRAGRLGREVFLFALRRNSRPGHPTPGVIPAVELDPWYVADQLMMTETEASTGLAAAISAGLLMQINGAFEISGWDDEWGRRPMTPTERQAKHRARVTERDGVTPATLPIVTGNACHASDVDQNRTDEDKEKSSRAISLRASRDTDSPSARGRKGPLPSGWTPDRTDANLQAESSARERGVDLSLELAKLRDWAKGGNEKKVDWNSAWRNWTRNAKPPPPRRQWTVEDQFERVRMLEEQEREELERARRTLPP